MAALSGGGLDALTPSALTGCWPGAVHQHSKVVQAMADGLLFAYGDVLPAHETFWVTQAGSEP
jgi:hypothetical protein